LLGGKVPAGEWIFDAGADPKTGVSWFRKSFRLESVPKQALVLLASRGYHEFYVNGKKGDDRGIEPWVLFSGCSQTFLGGRAMGRRRVSSRLEPKGISRFRLGGDLQPQRDLGAFSGHHPADAPRRNHRGQEGRCFNNGIYALLLQTMDGVSDALGKWTRRPGVPCPGVALVPCSRSNVPRPPG
jgi:hypothetical protein